MRIGCLQHVSFETAGAIETWATSRRAHLFSVALYDDQPVPSVKDLDALIIMGGPMSVNEGAKFPYLSAEKLLVKECLERQKKVLGICLGAQIIASALGSKVFSNKEREIGWLPITVSEPEGFLASLGDLPSVFHWHGETFDLPAGAVHLASSVACHNQAFSYGENILALQFHLEVTSDGIDALMHHCHTDLGSGQFAQTADEIIRGKEHLPVMHDRLQLVLDRFFETS
ncbi:MAG: amidotransferase [Deltaproteobacteria bacterium]|nr:amidotransferase [Deltaproteobacteria bacterium]